MKFNTRHFVFIYSFIYQSFSFFFSFLTIIDVTYTNIGLFYVLPDLRLIILIFLLSRYISLYLQILNYVMIKYN